MFGVSGQIPAGVRITVCGGCQSPTGGPTARPTKLTDPMSDPISQTPISQTMSDETIFALSSGRLPSAVAIIRISGPASRFAVETVTGRPVPEARRGVLRQIRAADGELIDEGLVIWWPGPGSFTGEDVAELQVHGSRAVVARVVKELGSLPGLRPALPGGFTRQAFLNGRMDLTAVEGLGDLIAAETEDQRRGAISQMSGRLRARCDDWREALVRARAWIEAGIDFTDEADVPEDVQNAAWGEVAALGDAIRSVLTGSRAAERIRDGLSVVLMGSPNAGKSSLMNWLAGRDVAIVSDEAGTTRDLIEVDLDLGGYPVRLIDTAGLRDGGGHIEQEGMRRARERAARADLILLLEAVDLAPSSTQIPEGPPVWRLRTKVDLMESDTKRNSSIRGKNDDKRIVDGPLDISIESGTGLDGLVAELRQFAEDLLGTRESELVLQTRHVDLLKTCLEHLDAALAARVHPELAGEELRWAGLALGRISGMIAPDEVLGHIFSRFCIGK
jgi:tRNA modification GTPase